ncbi:MAG: tyrosine-type recombinase/integrase [Bacteroidales bacterium]|nr:tyrosine-type recombinase/integrase [Bacteroidales bacterium]
MKYPGDVASVGNGQKIREILCFIQYSQFLPAEAFLQKASVPGSPCPSDFHCFRHTCVTLLCYKGVPITTVQKILGHTKVTTTQIYQEVMLETVIRHLERAEMLR